MSGKRGPTIYCSLSRPAYCLIDKFFRSGSHMSLHHHRIYLQSLKLSTGDLNTARRRTVAARDKSQFITGSRLSFRPRAMFIGTKWAWALIIFGPLSAQQLIRPCGIVLTALLVDLHAAQRRCQGCTIDHLMTPTLMFCLWASG